MGNNCIDCGKVISMAATRCGSCGAKHRVFHFYKGKKRSEETKQKIRNTLLGHKMSENTIQKIKEKRATQKIKHSEETKRKISISNKGKKKSPETIRKMSQSRIGKGCREKNPNWKGGKSFEEYGVAFSVAFKRVIRTRENKCCFMCNEKEENLPENLSIHHVDYNKLNSMSQNCVALCRSCHTLTNCNRTHWTKFLQGLLFERCGYKYTEDQKMIIEITE